MAAALTNSYASEEDSPLSEINVTPLVDVILVLLIVFMITVPVLVTTARVEVNVPDTYALPTDQNATTLAFTLKRNSLGQPTLFLNGQATDETALRKTFAERGTPMANLPASLSADRGIEYGAVIQVVDLLESLGFHKLALETRHVERR
ncbi:MAG: biopolymer transporter ExbD [Pirellulales bacterium]|nr:biopolymer transporter ExbD [Pirellulales bacterium]